MTQAKSKSGSGGSKNQQVNFRNFGNNSLKDNQLATLDVLDAALKQQWNLGQNILLCWCLSPKGIKILPAPHYFLGQFSASLNDCAPVDRLEALNGSYIREMICGSRQLSCDDFLGAVSRLQLDPVTIELPINMEREPELHGAVDELIKRYSINYVKSRAVLLFDIVNFSLASPFEQTSQLSSLSYSLNAAHSKLLERNIEINFSRTTTGDGYYIWHHEETPRANLELYEFMIMVIADNALAQRAAAKDPKSGLVVPQIRTGFHIGSHFEFYQVEGITPGMNSFIVGDVTIELARMLDLAGSGQIFIGEFDTLVPTSFREGAYLIPVDSQRFVDRALKQMVSLLGVTLSGENVEAIHCYLTGETGASGGQTIRRFCITDKHGRSRNVYNLRIIIKTDSSGSAIILGQQDNDLPKRHYRRNSDIKITGHISRLNKPRVKPRASIAAFED